MNDHHTIKHCCHYIAGQIRETGEKVSFVCVQDDDKHSVDNGVKVWEQFIGEPCCCNRKHLVARHWALRCAVLSYFIQCASVYSTFAVRTHLPNFSAGRKILESLILWIKVLLQGECNTECPCPLLWMVLCAELDFWDLQIFMVAPWNGADHYIFILSFVLSFFFLSIFFPRLISAAADWVSTILPHMMWP